MVLQRFASEQHFVEEKGGLTAAREDGTGGGSLTVSFFPAPGDGLANLRVFDLPTSPHPPGPAQDPHQPGRVDLPSPGPVLGRSAIPAAVMLQRPSPDPGSG